MSDIWITSGGCTLYLNKRNCLAFIEIKSAASTGYPYVTHYALLGCSDTWLLAKVALGVWIFLNYDFLVYLHFFQFTDSCNHTRNT